MLKEMIAVAISLPACMWLPYDTRITSPSIEYYASVRLVNEKQTVEFSDRDLADKICAYTEREVQAYYQANNYEPLKFTYTADKTQPVFNSITPLSNDLSSVCFALNVLKSKASLGTVLSNTKVNNIMLGYLRSLNSNYSDGSSLYDGIAWRVCTGLQQPIADSWKDIESKVRYHDSTRNFFARYVRKSEYNSTDHGSLPSDIDGWGNSVYSLPDPNNEGNIDLIHMFASIDGEISNTYLSENDASFNLDGTNIQKDLLGWGGDLQTLTYEITKRDKISSFETILTESQYFKTEDFLADVDAFNIAKICDNGTDLYNAFCEYYDRISENPIARYSDFANAITAETTYEWKDASVAQKVERESYALMGLKWTEEGYIDVYNSGIAYKLISKNTDVNIRKKIAGLFGDYIIRKACLS